MNNTSRVFKELRERWSDLSAIHKNDDMVAVGIRFQSGEIRKAVALFEQLPQLLHLLFEHKHQETADKEDDNLLSVFICDSTGNPFYDSNDYKPSKNKFSLKRDGDRRVLRFGGMTTEDKDQVVDLTVEQVHAHIDEVKPDDDLNKKQGTDTNPWGDMPW